MSHTSNFLPATYDDDPESFFWPVQRDDVVTARDRFLRGILEYAKNNSENDPYADYYSILSLQWSNHIVQFYHFLKAKSEFEKREVAPYLSGDAGFFTDICNGKMPPMPTYLKGFYQGVKPQNPCLEPVRIVKNYFSSGTLSRKPLFMINLTKDIVVSSTGPLIFKHAEMSNEPVFYLPRSTWFKKPINPKPASLNIDTAPLIAILKESFEDEAHLISQDVENWFEELFTKTLYACQAHIHRLLASPQKLPKKLWIGSGGIFWDRILKYAVTKTGGHVTGHDHGSGTGHVKSISRTLAECADCNVFVPFSDNPALFTDAIIPEFLADEKIPEVRPLNLKKNLSSKTTTIMPKADAPHILIVPYGPDLNIPRFLTVPHDSVKTDFLVRTIKQLKKWGYSVSIKPHPHCHMPLTQNCLDELGVNQITTDIISAFKQADIILFSSIYTTTFREAFDANKPMILIDMKYEEWVSGAKEKLAKRCSIIDGNYDSNGRITFDWKHLKSAIKEAPLKSDSEYYDTYYSGFM